MNSNLKALSAQLYCAVSNWNDDTESDTGERILSESEVGALSEGLYDLAIDDLKINGHI